MNRINRRNLLLTAAAVSIPAAVGCSKDSVHETIDSIDTETIESASVALKGFAIVSCMVGPRIVALPAPGVRVLAVCLVVSGIATKLAIEYLDVELKRRYITEALEEAEAKQIEQDLAVTFSLENGDKETVVLGANKYE